MQVAIDKLSDVLRCCPHFDHLLNFCTSKDTYLVGGAIRDALIGRPITDLDLISASDPTSIAKLFARQIGGHWFWLDKDRLQSRVVVNHKDDCLHYDFALFRAPTLELDLLDRDFTINAMALPLTEELSIESLIDPCGGVADLGKNFLQMVGRDSFANDPLRIIKGVRHATTLGLDIDVETLRAMQQEVVGLDRIAPERIRQEIWKILVSQQADRGFHLLQECGAGQKLFGDKFDKTISVLIDCLKNSRNCWHRLDNENGTLRKWLSQEVEQGLCNEVLLLWTFTLALVERELPILVADMWRLSRKAKASIAAIVAVDMTRLKEFSSLAHNERAYSWWAIRCGIDPKLLLLTLAVVGTQVAENVSIDIQPWVRLVDALEEKRPADLVGGHWLRNELHLDDGPEMTKALELLRNAEIFGQVDNEDEAHQFLLQHYQNKD